jgi:hypothetical protein
LLVIHTGGVAAHSWVGLNDVETIQNMGKSANTRAMVRPMAWCQRKGVCRIYACFPSNIMRARSADRPDEPRRHVQLLKYFMPARAGAKTNNCDGIQIYSAWRSRQARHEHDTLRLCQPGAFLNGGVQFDDDTVFDRIAAPNIAFVAGRSMGWAIRAALPWLAILLAFLVIVTYVPEISLTLPNLIDQWRGIK